MQETLVEGPITCRICLKEEENVILEDYDTFYFYRPVLADDFSEYHGWLRSPCMCTGSAEFVHDDCLQEWRRYSKSNKCTTCGARYHGVGEYDGDRGIFMSLALLRLLRAQRVNVLRRRAEEQAENKTIMDERVRIYEEKKSIGHFGAVDPRVSTIPQHEPDNCAESAKLICSVMFVFCFLECLFFLFIR